MTTAGGADLGGLGPIDRALLPRDVREGSREDQRTYAAALGFERVLVTELARALTATSQGGDPAAGAATKAYREQLPATLADAMAAQGGIGLAEDLYRAMTAGRTGEQQ